VYNDITFEASYRGFAVVQFSSALRNDHSSTVVSSSGVAMMCSKLERRMRLGDEPAMCKFSIEVAILSLVIKRLVDGGLLKEDSMYIGAVLGSAVGEVLASLNADDSIDEDDLSLEDISTLTNDEFNRLVC
jgi:hypothetical protein